MSRSLFLVALLASAVAVTAATHAQNGGVKCGPVAYDQATQSYVGIPCTNPETPEASAANSSTAAAPKQKCGPVAYDQATQSYVGIPCAANTTEENPAGRTQ